jgi:hypothetical protein
MILEEKQVYFKLVKLSKTSLLLFKVFRIPRNCSVLVLHSFFKESKLYLPTGTILFILGFRKILVFRRNNIKS